MTRPSEFAASIYLGDRACKAISIDTWNAVVRVQIDCISRIRSPAGTWDFYTDEDVYDGFLVFDTVRSVELANDGHPPNDSIDEFEVRERADGAVEVEMSISAVDAEGTHFDTTLRLECRSISIEDPKRPNERIVD